MSKIYILLLSISFLLQSCYSYKTVDLKSSKLVAEKQYKINANNKITKGKLLNANDTSLVFRTVYKEKTILFKDIKTIKKRKFSVVKTVALVPVTVTTLTILFVLADPIQINFDGISMPN